MQSTYLDPVGCQKPTAYSETSTGVENIILKNKPHFFFGLSRGAVISKTALITYNIFWKNAIVYIANILIKTTL